MPRIALWPKQGAAVGPTGRSVPGVTGSGGGDGDDRNECEDGPILKKARSSLQKGKDRAVAPVVAAAAAAGIQVKKKSNDVGEFIEELTTGACVCSVCILERFGTTIEPLLDH